jgi:hypothetical protein
MARAPGKYDVQNFWRGNTLVLSFAFKEADNTPTNLTGVKLVFRFETRTGIVVEKTTDTPPTTDPSSGVITDGITITDAVAGTATLVIKPDDTMKAPRGEDTPYELELWQNGRQFTVLYGNLKTVGGVNKNV